MEHSSTLRIIGISSFAPYTYTTIGIGSKNTLYLPIPITDKVQIPTYDSLYLYMVEFKKQPMTTYSYVALLIENYVYLLMSIVIGTDIYTYYYLYLWIKNLQKTTYTLCYR